MNLKTSALIAVGLSLLLITGWELYWRSQNYYPTLNDDKALWALHRAKLEKSSKEDIVVIGSSRAYFDIQLDVWNAVTGKKPIQLSSTGSSPLPVFHDIVNNTDFNGTIIVGITPGLFFSTTFPEAFPWQRPQSKVDYYHDRTYAQRLNFRLSIPLQENLVLMSGDEEEWADDIDLKSLLRRIKIGNRTGKPVPPPFYYFGDVNLDRNMSMTKKTSRDTAFANTIIEVWKFFGAGAPPPDKKSTLEFFLEDVKKFKEQNGNLILVRFPSSGGIKAGESQGLPRIDYWDELVKKANVTAYHYEDYEQLENFDCPEWSHLSAEDATTFTEELVKLMLEDKVLTNHKSK